MRNFIHDLIDGEYQDGDFMILGIYIRYLVFWSCLMAYQVVLACAPSTSDDVFIARLDTSQHNLVKLNRSNFIFRSLGMKIRLREPKIWTFNFDTKQIQKMILRKNQWVIGLAYAQDGLKPQYYTVTTLAPLYCENDKISIGQSIVPYLAWNREKGRCAFENEQSINLLDGFIQYDQAYYLKKLHQKYATCQQLHRAF